MTVLLQTSDMLASGKLVPTEQLKHGEFYSTVNCLRTLRFTFFFDNCLMLYAHFLLRIRCLTSRSKTTAGTMDHVQNAAASLESIW